MFIPTASMGEMSIPPDTRLPAANYALARNTTFSTNWNTKRRVYLERDGRDVTRVRLVPQCVLRFVHIVDARTF